MCAALTKRIVAAAQPRERPYELRDAQVRGLLLRVQPSGHKAWIVTWAHGKRRTLGSAGHLSLDQARHIAAKVIAEFIQTGLATTQAPSHWLSPAPHKAQVPRRKPGGLPGRRAG